MPVVAECCSRFATISRAAAKAAGARLRNLRMLRVAPDWARKASICETCPMRVIRRGVSYCGDPFLDKLDRDVTVEGCGCPCQAKARSPNEHCPLNPSHRPAERTAHACNCKWCASKAAA
jgi:hypothetical protein